MSRLISEHHGLLSRSDLDDWRQRFAPRRRRNHVGPHPGLLVAGTVAVGLGLLAFYYIGPDLKRYIKLRNM